MKKNIVLANWKMNFDFHETTSFIRNLLKFFYDQNINHKKKIILAPSFPFLHISNQIVQGTKLKIAAQNVHHMEKGTYTGEVSALMLSSIGIYNVIIGHSERRTLCFETGNILLNKIKISIKYGFNIFLCIGETDEERKKNEHFNVIRQQLEDTVFHFSVEKIRFFYIAYEPIWAIGTGKIATIEQIQNMHCFIRSLFLNKYGESISNKLYILYGGSINHVNAKEIFLQKDVDGGIIGNCSLEFSKFLKIIQF
ncbi:triose-phosphate isomerase [Blattabacterium cuenoti]|uniref:triose-phosphate isomerase n=1 Tax=Blattabacterium cuenoti TaxID=1653831 RepID=UPI00163C79AF|nr:triose-phosphate isomerase [Blattabacterium cuenoti]